MHVTLVSAAVFSQETASLTAEILRFSRVGNGLVRTHWTAPRRGRAVLYGVNTIVLGLPAGGPGHHLPTCTPRPARQGSAGSMQAGRIRPSYHPGGKGIKRTAISAVVCPSGFCLYAGSRFARFSGNAVNRHRARSGAACGDEGRSVAGQHDYEYCDEDGANGKGDRQDPAS
jgi:hypothetical protein